MRHIVNFLVATFISIALPFFSIGFVLSKYNPVLWEKGHRLVLVMTSVTCATICYSLCLFWFIDNRDKKK